MHIKPDVIVFIAVLVIAAVIGAATAAVERASAVKESAIIEESAILAGSTLEPGNAERGKDIAARLCSGCHALPPATVSPVVDAPPFSELVQRWPVENLAEALAEGIMVSHGDHVQMPEFAFEPQEVEDLLAYLDSIKS